MKLGREVALPRQRRRLLLEDQREQLEVRGGRVREAAGRELHQREAHRPDVRSHVVVGPRRVRRVDALRLHVSRRGDGENMENKWAPSTVASRIRSNALATTTREETIANRVIPKCARLQHERGSREREGASAQ